MDPKLLNIAIKIKIQTKISQKSNVYIFFLLFNLRSGKKWYKCFYLSHTIIMQALSRVTFSLSIDSFFAYTLSLLELSDIGIWSRLPYLERIQNI